MKNLALIIIMIAGLIILWRIRQPELNEYNRYMCANYGYEEDCKTVLPDYKKLK